MWLFVVLEYHIKSILHCHPKISVSSGGVLCFQSLLQSAFPCPPLFLPFPFIPFYFPSTPSLLSIYKPRFLDIKTWVSMSLFFHGNNMEILMTQW